MALVPGIGGLWFAVLLLMCSSASAGILLPNGTFTESSLEMRLKVVGGYFDVVREYRDGRWQANARHNPLSFERDSIDNSVRRVTRNGVKYERQGDGWVADNHDVIRAATVLRLLPTTSEGQAPADISASTPAATLAGGLATESIPGYRWSDRRGNWIDYDGQGRIVGYGDRNDVRVWFQYGATGIDRVRDHFGRTVLTIEGDVYRDNPALYGGQPGDQVSVTIGQGDFTDVRNKTTLVESKDVVTGYDVIYESGVEASRQPIKERRPIKITDPEGHVRRYEYEATGRIGKITRADGSEVSYIYDYDKTKREFYVRMVAQPATPGPPARITELWYDDEGLVIRRDINGETVYRMRAMSARSRELTDARGLQTLRTTDEFENPTEVVYPDGSKVTARYDVRYSNVLEEIDELGVKTSYAYDARGNLIRVTEAVGTADERTVELTVDAFGHVTTAKYVAGPETDEAIVRFEYDDRGNLIQLTDAESNATQYVHDRHGNVTRMTDARGKIWRWTYDRKGYLASEINPLDETTTFERDSRGRLLTVVDPLGKAFGYEYDGRGHLTRAIDAYGKISRSAFDFLGRLTLHADADAIGTGFTYDLRGRLLSMIDGRSNITALDYADPDTGDSTGNAPARLRYPTYEQRLKYDSRNRLTTDQRVLDGQTLVTLYRYDARGQRIEAEDPTGKIVHYGYNALGQLSTVTDRLGAQTTFAYDRRGNLISVTDPRQNVWRYRYDRANRLVEESLPLGQTRTIAYDGTGNPTLVTDFNGNQTAHSYDDAGRLTRSEVRKPGEDTPSIVYSYGYDAAGNLTTWSDGSTSSVLVYDDNRRLRSETVDYGGGIQLTYRYSYTDAGRKKTLEYPDGTVVSYSYDSHGGVSSVSIPDEGILSVNDWNWQAPKKITLPGGTVKDLSQDGLLNLTHFTVKSPAGHVRVAFEAQRNSLLDVVRRRIDGHDITYSYDDEQRLTQAESSSLTEAWTYDSVGNRLTDATTPGEWQYDANNRLLSQGDTTYAYDANGNLTTQTVGTRATQYDYDGLGRLTRITDADGTVIAEYAYDPFNRRIRKDTASGRTYFLYAQEGLIAEANATGSITVQYGWRPDGLWGTDPVFIKTAIGSGATATTGYAYFHTDQIGTPIRSTDKNGMVVWSAEATAFGITTPNATNQLTSNLRFAGQYYDAETGTHYNWHRNYAPALGRYVERDPIGLLGGTNSYAYAGGGPASEVDPFGLQNFSYHEFNATAQMQGAQNAWNEAAAVEMPRAAEVTTSAVSAGAGTIALGLMLTPLAPAAPAFTTVSLVAGEASALIHSARTGERAVVNYISPVASSFAGPAGRVTGGILAEVVAAHAVGWWDVNNSVESAISAHDEGMVCAVNE